MADRPVKVLIVNSDPRLRAFLKEGLSDRGYDCVPAATSEQALSRISEDFDAVLMDIIISNVSGIELLTALHSRFPQTAVIVLTAVIDLQVAVESMKAGALDYLTGPLDLGKVDNALSSAMKSGTSASFNAETADSDLKAIEAIATGVEAQHEMLDIHAEKVIRQTIEIARKMAFAEEKIEKWAAIRQRRQYSRTRFLSDSILKLAGKAETRISAIT